MVVVSGCCKEVYTVDREMFAVKKFSSGENFTRENFARAIGTCNFRAFNFRRFRRWRKLNARKFNTRNKKHAKISRSTVYRYPLKYY